MANHAKVAIKNPEANEPSDAAYTMQRISAIVAIVVIAISIVALILNQKAASEQREKDSRALERSQKEEREELGYPEFARRAREVFGVPGSEVVIRYPRESSLRKENLDIIEGGLAPVGWLPYDNERSEPSFLSYLIGACVNGGWGLRYRPRERTDLVARLPFSWKSDCETTVYAVTETEAENPLVGKLFLRGRVGNLECEILSTGFEYRSTGCGSTKPCGKPTGSGAGRC